MSDPHGASQFTTEGVKSRTEEREQSTKEEDEGNVHSVNI
jgi:hypothetical protein